MIKLRRVPSSAQSAAKTRSIRSAGGVVLAVVFAGAVSACGSDGESTATAPSSVVAAAESTTPALATTTTAEVAPAAPAETTATAAPAPVAPVVLMPPVVCLNLQAAQNLIQDAGIFFSRSEDASGASRMQVNDSNWIVVDQQPGVGVPIGEGEAVLSVVKIEEPNNC